MAKQEIDGTINLESQKKPEKKYPDVPKNLDEAETQKIKDSSVSLYTLANRELEYINGTCKQLEFYDALVIKKLWLACEKLQVIRKAITDGSGSTPVPEHDDDTGDDIEKELRLFKKYIRKMKLPIPTKFNAKDLEKQLKDLDKSATKSAEQIAALVLLKQVPRLHRNPTFENSPAFKDFEGQYNELSTNLKLCLLCFSVFPARAIIKKRLIVYWWIAEGFIEQEGDKDLEQLGAEYFDKLIQKDFIKPYHNKRRLEVETCKMPPLIRSAVISIAARAKFFDFHATGKPTAECTSSFRSALLGDQRGLETHFKFEKFHAVFNVSENVLDIRPEWIQRMKNVVVLYLGRWQSIGNHHIEVDDEKFLESLSDMKHLKLLSLQGISRIVALPDQVTKLENLTILDLRACHNIERIPEDIGLLKSLTHLDLSECYLLERIPKGLSKLGNLLVLKGFAVVKPSKHSCSLEDLSKLLKLRKLSIFTGLKEFPGNSDLIAFQKFKALTKLKVVWGGGEKKENEELQNHTAEKNQETSRATLANGNDRGSTTEPLAVQALEVDTRKVPQDTTTSSSKGSALHDTAKLPKLRGLKQNFCFGGTTPLETDNKIAASDAMNSAEPVPQFVSEPAAEPKDVQGPKSGSEVAAEPKNVQGPTSGSEVTSAPKSERGLTVSDPAGEITKGPQSSMSKSNSSSKSPAHEGSSKLLKWKRWKRIWNKSTSENGNDDAGSHHLPLTLEKLELQCFPNNKAPGWLNPTKLEKLKKLYIRGGQLCELGGNTGGWNKPVDPWRVKILRLKYLTGLTMHWKEVDKLFPDLIFLEKVNCPMLTFFPCDEAGVWINKEKLPKQQPAGGSIYL
ncbi:hypothetical protein POM88_014901 [Heracleum sosnowskyi]|uniref:Disease resistance RPP13-like protein 4 n=1 Tax=Heracleum sosnowskyi TaxID=360622 RepID=A0AAD8IKA2_9APIA|nr:hypothetical protein POM88_014901 [Heracleum sosnowskyi]